MPKEPRCPKHKLALAKCGCKAMHYKEAYKIPKRLEEIPEYDLETAWWKALRRDELGTIYCDPEVFKTALIKLLKG